MTLERIMQSGETPITQKSELGEVFDNLDDDTQDFNTKMSSVDINTKLSMKQISASLVFDEFQRKGLFPVDWALTRQLKRLMKSEKGWLTELKTQLGAGLRDHQAKTTITEKFKGLFQKHE